MLPAEVHVRLRQRHRLVEFAFRGGERCGQQGCALRARGVLVLRRRREHGMGNVRVREGRLRPHLCRAVQKRRWPARAGGAHRCCAASPDRCTRPFSGTQNTWSSRWRPPSSRRATGPAHPGCLRARRPPAGAREPARPRRRRPRLQVRAVPASKRRRCGPRLEAAGPPPPGAGLPPTGARRAHSRRRRLPSSAPSPRQTTVRNAAPAHGNWNFAGLIS